MLIRARHRLVGRLQGRARLRLRLVQEAPQDAGARRSEIGAQGGLGPDDPGAHGHPEGAEPQRAQRQTDALAGEGAGELPQGAAHGRDDEADEEDLVEQQ